MLIVGLAPGLGGANRTGRPFTGDWAGELLYETLQSFGYSHGSYDRRIDDGLALKDCLITNAVRCVPPGNKPSPAEIASCRAFLAATIGRLSKLRAVLALGRIAHDSVVRAGGSFPSRFAFGHGKRHSLVGLLPHAITLFDSYHCSRYNTNTGVLTRQMFQAVFADIRNFVASSAGVAPQRTI